MSVRMLGAIALVAVLVIGGSGALPGQNVLQGLTRADLQRHDLSIAGREMVQATITLAPGVTAPDHSHPGEEVIYVLQGRFEYRVAGKPIRLQAGGVLFIPAGTVHSATNIGTGDAVELATYIVKKGSPLVVPVR